MLSDNTATHTGKAAHRWANAESEGDVCNYVVEIASQRILGKTGCAYFGTRRRYNHRECDVTWSPDSTFFVQLWDDKWASESCWAGRIAVRMDSAPCFRNPPPLTRASHGAGNSLFSSSRR